MNAQKKLDEAQATIRNLTIERDALKTKSEVQRKALAHEAMETARLRALFDTIKKLVKDTAGSEADILSKVVAEFYRLLAKGEKCQTQKLKIFA